MWALMKRAIGTNKTLYATQAFYTFDLWYIDESLKHHKVPVKLHRLVHGLYNEAKSRVIVGLRQGCVLSLLLFSLYINGLVDELKKSSCVE